MRAGVVLRAVQNLVRERGVQHLAARSDHLDQGMPPGEHVGCSRGCAFEMARSDVAISVPSHDDAAVGPEVLQYTVEIVGWPIGSQIPQHGSPPRELGHRHSHLQARLENCAGPPQELMPGDLASLPLNCKAWQIAHWRFLC